ncbi:MAG TPA: FtsX-like permease family protein, partial [Flavobacteriales bacterium]|nr:FtsX-like permease family protein [Flavobacteriales bacterium]
VPGTDIELLADRIGALVGPRFKVLSRYRKNELMYRTNAIEKRFTFGVLAFIALIGAFNIIASLTLMMIEKQRDMRTLAGMGATASFVRRVFFAEGMLIVGVGTVAGLLLGLFVCGIQLWTGVVRLEGSVVKSYPVQVMVSDLALIFLAVMAIGILATATSLMGLWRRSADGAVGYLQAARA